MIITQHRNIAQRKHYLQFLTQKFLTTIDFTTKKNYLIQVINGGSGGIRTHEAFT